MSRLRKAARATVVVQLFSLAGAALSLVTVPLYLQWLGTERYGLMLTAFACAGYLMFSDAGLSWASMLLIAQAHGRDDRAEIARIVRNSVSLAALSSILVIAVVFGVYWLTSYSRAPGLFKNLNLAEGLAFAVGFQVLVSLACSPIYNIFIGLQETQFAAIYQGAARIIGTGASLLAAAWGASLGIIMISASVCALLAGFACGLHAWRRHRWAFAHGPFWDRQQIRTQYRTGAKSFALQIGRVLTGSAPVLSITSQTNARFVPGFTVPLTLLNIPLSVVMSFNATLQPGYGEAIGKHDYSWIRATIQSLLRNLLLFQMLLTAGFIVLAPAVIRLWTHGKIQLSASVMISVLLVGLTTSTLSVFQFALSGTNRHRLAGLSELGNGLLSLCFGALVVRFCGYQWVGVGIFAAAALTSGWILPREIATHFDMKGSWPDLRFTLCVVGAGGLAIAAGRLCRWIIPTAPPILLWLSLVLTGVAIVGVYVAITRILLPDDYNRLHTQFKEARKRVRKF